MLIIFESIEVSVNYNINHHIVVVFVLIDRVEEFIETPPAVIHLNHKSKETKSTTASKRTVGVLDYMDNKEVSGIILLQNKYNNIFITI